MKNKHVLFILLIVNGINSFSQDAKKMSKHLTVFVNDKFSSKESIMFERLNPGKHGWDETLSEFKNAFLLNGFKISENARYVLIIDYDYGYSISQYRMQCSNLKGQIIDIANNREIVGTFNYNGRYETNLVPPAIAIELKKH